MNIQLNYEFVDDLVRDGVDIHLAIELALIYNQNYNSPTLRAFFRNNMKRREANRSLRDV